MLIRPAIAADFDAIWPFFKTIVRAGDTYAFPADCNKTTAFSLWMETPQQTFVAEINGEILATYYIKPNQAGPGAHVCNCGYMVAPETQGKGVATALCQHSLQTALDFGFKAMQFNSVVSSNEGAIHLWQKLGFAIVGRVPKAFNHPQRGYIDTLVMYQWLD